MKTILLTTILSVFAITNSKSQNQEKAIEKTVLAYVKAGDENNAEKLASFLDDSYRIVLNRQFGSEQVTVVPKTVYLEKIASKEWGGDQRKVEISSIDINGINAVVRVTFSGQKMTTVNYLTLVKTSNDQWKLVNDIPLIQ